MSALATLLYPFRTGALALPGNGERALFLGAVPGLDLPDGFGAEIFPVQNLRPSFLALSREGRPVVPQASGEDFDWAFVLCTRHRGENEARVAEALARLKAGGRLVVAGAKDEGIDALRRRLAERLGIEGHLAKHHGAAFWLRRAAGPARPPSFPDAGAPALADFVAAPGMFSHDHVDPGSRLLAEHLPADLAGAVADFAAGWGYLAVEVAKRCPKVASLDLYEADFAALEAARQNLARHAEGKPAGFFWHDLLAEPVARRYDAIVMNPPFHRGRAAEPALGQGMVAAAGRALRKGGRLWMVANRGLPYEPALAAGFSSSEEVVRDGSFRVFAARR